MAISRSVLPFLVLLLCTVGVADFHTFIETLCSATSYPELCVESLSPYTITVQQSWFQMGLTAMTVSLTNGQSARSYLDPLADSLTKECLEVVKEIVDGVSKTIGDLTTMGRASTTQLETLLSSPLSGNGDCFDFESDQLDTNTQDLIQTQVTNFAQVTSDAIVLVNNI